MTASPGVYRRTRNTPAEIEDTRIQLHRELTEIVLEAVTRLAPELAAEFQRGMEQKFGGGKGPLYVHAPDKSARNATIRAEFNGTNAEAVCRKHGISRTTLYCIANQRP